MGWGDKNAKQFALGLSGDKSAAREVDRARPVHFGEELTEEERAANIKKIREIIATVSGKISALPKNAFTTRALESSTSDVSSTVAATDVPAPAAEEEDEDLPF